MSLIRPEAAAELNRWREVLIGGAVILLGVYWGFFTGGGLLHWIGYAVVLGGIVLCFAGVQRARFRQGGGGQGIVQVVEGRISYFGPLTGGVVDIADLRSLVLDPTASPPHWVLKQEGLQTLFIPLDAEGADALFDAFALLPGIRTERMLSQMRDGADHPIVIWQAGPSVNRSHRLH